MNTLKRSLAATLFGGSLLFAQLPNPLGLPDPLHLTDGAGLPNPLNLPDPLGFSRPATPKAQPRPQRKLQRKHVRRKPRKLHKHHP